MSLIFLLLLCFNNLYNTVLCQSQCKEYIIIMKETTCASSSSAFREPITLKDIELNQGNCSADPLKTLSYDEKESNNGYLIKFDYIGFESICVPIFRSTKLLDHITIDPSIHEKSNDIVTTTDIENNGTETSLLQCFIKNYTDTCDKENTHEELKAEINKSIVEIDLIYMNKTTGNSPNLIYNKTEVSILFEQCALTEYTCKDYSTIDDYTKHNHNATKTIMASLGNTRKTSKDINKNYTVNFDCLKVINKLEKVNVSLVTKLTYNIISQYACQNEFIDNLDISKTLFNVKVYIPNNLTIINRKLENTYCKEIFKPVKDALSVDCHTVQKQSNHSSEVDIDLIYVDETTKKNNKKLISNKTEVAIFFKQCLPTDDICNKHDIGNTKNNFNISKTIIALIGREAKLMPPIITNGYIDNFNCTDVISDPKNINIEQFTTLTYSILTKYDCQSKSKVSKEVNTIPRYNVRVYLSTDLNVMNTKMKNINCKDNFDPIDNYTLRIDCNTVGMSTTEPTSTSDISSTEAQSFETTFNKSLIWHCKLMNITKMKGPEANETFNSYKVHGFGDCNEGDRYNYNLANKDGSNVLIIHKEIKTEDDILKTEDSEVSTNKNSLKLHLILSNPNSSNETIPFNITKGRIIYLWSKKDENPLNSSNFSFVTLMIMNDINNNTKAVQTDDSLELDIILMDKRNKLNEYITNNLKDTLLNDTKRSVLSCVSFNETVTDDNAVMECLFIDISTKMEQMKDNDTTVESDMKKHEEDIYYISPTVWGVLIGTLLAVVITVCAYAYCLFRSRKREYHVAPTRDWAAMDETQF